MRQAYVAGAGNTSFGRHEGSGALDLMAQAAQRALEDSGLSAAPEGFDPYRVLEMKQLRERLLLIVDALPERERRILKWHYFEHMDFKHIGEALGLSKGRISQLHARGLKLMRESLRSIERFDLSF